jgi:hypothetical protein
MMQAAHWTRIESVTNKQMKRRCYRWQRMQSEADNSTYNDEDAIFVAQSPFLWNVHGVEYAGSGP